MQVFVRAFQYNHHKTKSCSNNTSKDTVSNLSYLSDDDVCSFSSSNDHKCHNCDNEHHV